MAGFLYFIEGDQRTPNAARIDALGLRYAFATAKLESRPASSGPGGKSGGVFCDPDRHADRTIGYYPDQQSWEKVPPVEGRPQLYLGLWNDAPPAPDDLERPAMLPGVVRFQAGEHWWVIPTLTEFDDAGGGECTLPATERLRDGAYVFELIPPMARLWEQVHPVALGLCGFAPPRPPEEVKAAAIALLQANYVVDRPELALLGALANDDRYQRIVLASCRGQWLIDATKALADPEKKTVPSPPNDSDTPAGDEG